MTAGHTCDEAELNGEAGVEFSALSSVLAQVDLATVFPGTVVSDTDFLVKLRAGIEASQGQYSARNVFTSSRVFAQLAGVCIVVFVLVMRFGIGPAVIDADPTLSGYVEPELFTDIVGYGLTDTELEELADANITADSIAIALGMANIHLVVDLTESDEATDYEILELDDVAIAAVMSELESTEFF
ncbi:hypothetical protein HZB60_04315 [candidate division KSB1 bacterium]|nr:hypothetical protein [candidate division KSB1 bacterium]